MIEPITVQRDGHVLLIGVNRPAKRNAVNLAAMDALCGAYEILGTDDQLRAGVLFAHGDHFSAGLDLAEVGPAVAEHGPRVLGRGARVEVDEALFVRELLEEGEFLAQGSDVKRARVNGRGHKASPS